MTVTSAEPLPMESVRDAIDEAGYSAVRTELSAGK